MAEVGGIASNEVAGVWYSSFYGPRPQIKKEQARFRFPEESNKFK